MRVDLVTCEGAQCSADPSPSCSSQQLPPKQLAPRPSLSKLPLSPAREDVAPGSSSRQLAPNPAGGAREESGTAERAVRGRKWKLQPADGSRLTSQYSNTTSELTSDPLAPPRKRTSKRGLGLTPITPRVNPFVVLFLLGLGVNTFLFDVLFGLTRGVVLVRVRD